MLRNAQIGSPHQSFYLRNTEDTLPHGIDMHDTPKVYEFVINWQGSDALVSEMVQNISAIPEANIKTVNMGDNTDLTIQISSNDLLELRRIGDAIFVLLSEVEQANSSNQR